MKSGTKNPNYSDCELEFKLGWEVVKLMNSVDLVVMLPEMILEFRQKMGRVDCDIRTHKVVSLHLMDLS